MLQHPVENFNWKTDTSQLFGVNYKLYHDNFRLDGHNGLDYIKRTDKMGYGEKILAAHDGKVVRLNYETEWKTNGNGIYLQSTDGTYQTIYWHLSEIQVKIGQEVKAGETIGLMGNTGFVRPIPSSPYPYNGTHLHFALIVNGVWTDPTPYLVKQGDKLPIYFAQDLFIGKRNDEVAWLQTILKIELGDEIDWQPTGYFGYKTLSGVKLFQRKYKIEPVFGYCGIKTRKLLMERWSIYWLS